MESWRKELYHHGIKGQRWGVRRGPPYPIGESSKHLKSPSKPSERVDKRVEKSYAQTEKLSKAAKIGAVAALAGLAAYGAYKTGAFKHVQGIGEQAVKETLKGFASASVSVISNKTAYSDKAKFISEKTGLKLKDSVKSAAEDCRAANSDYDERDPAFKNNCGHACIAYLLRRMGLDVKARPMEGIQIENGMTPRDVARYFKGMNLELFTLNDASTSQKYEAALSKRLLDLCGGERGAFGMIGLIREDADGGHFVTWENEHSGIAFSDPQGGERGIEEYFRDMARGAINSTVVAFRLDDLDVMTESLGEVVCNA